MYRLLGHTDDVTTCEHCGKSELKGTVALENDVGNIVYFGSVCAARALGRGSSAKEGRAVMSEAVALRRAAEEAARLAAIRRQQAIEREIEFIVGLRHLGDTVNVINRGNASRVMIFTHDRGTYAEDFNVPLDRVPSVMESRRAAGEPPFQGLELAHLARSRGHAPRAFKPNGSHKANATRFKVLGTSADVDQCGHCGRGGLKRTVILGALDADGVVLSETHYGTSCAAAALGYGSVARAQKRVEHEASVADTERARREANDRYDAMVLRLAGVIAPGWRDVFPRPPVNFHTDVDRSGRTFTIVYRGPLAERFDNASPEDAVRQYEERRGCGEKAFRGVDPKARKHNPGAAQLAVVGIMGAGSAMALGRGYLAERRSRALDRELLATLAPWRLPPDTRLSPPVAGVHGAPRLRELGPAEILTPQWDDRKRELIAQARSGDVRVGTDRRGVHYLARPGQVPVEVEFSRQFTKRNGASAPRWTPSAEHPKRIEAFVGPLRVDVEPAAEVMRQRRDGRWVKGRGRAGYVIAVDDGGADPSVPGRFPTLAAAKREAVRVARGRLAKRNDARAVVSAVQPAPWAFAQYDDPRTGSWGVLIDGGTATLYRYDGASWRPTGPARWNETRGRLEGASAPTEVLSGIARAVLETPAARDALRAYLATVIPQSFTGTGREPPPLPSEARGPFRQVGRARCATDTAKRSRAGTKAREQAEAKAANELGVARLALAELCGRGGDPIADGSPCDVTLAALREIGPEAPCTLDAPPCPRQVTPQEVSAWRSGAFPPIGPYETTKPHAMGADPCCYYHPATQARIALRRRIEENLRDEVGSATWLRAVREAELDSPFASVWAACDRAMQRRVDPLAVVTGEGVGSSGAFLLLQAFYEAVQRNDGDALTDLYGRLRNLLGELPPMETLMELDANFWDLAIQEARDSGNLGYQRWVQTHGGKAGRTVFKRHARGQRGMG